MKRLVFSHANGFPAGVYRRLFAQWEAAGWQVEAIERLGHHPDYPVNPYWQGMRDQLLALIGPASAPPVWLVGHSLGGLLSLMAACHAPQRVRGVVLLDSPVISGWRAQSLKLLKHTGLIRRVSPGQVSQRRRQHWPSREAVLAHFQAKPAFARWHPQVLEDYVRAGFDDAEGDTVGGVHLGFRREVETRIYNSLPHHFDALLRQLRRSPQSAFPVGFIAGTQSAEMRQGGLTASKQLAGARFRLLEGTHLYPMERPDDTAQRVLELLASMP
jgi:pimeloyl-ACP methyl ester carboxylesterase